MSAAHLSAYETDVLATLRAAPAVAFGIDYDGTLAPIVARPELANATDEAVACIEQLATRSRDLVALVTGRSVEDLWARARTRKTWVLGRHGAQVAAPGGSPHLSEELDERELLGRLQPVREALEEKVWPVDGAFVEDKGAGFALHTRGVCSEVEAELHSFLEGVASKLETHDLLKGKRVLELRPRGIDKGKAFTALVEREAPSAQRFYIGDDTTDEDAFRALDGDAITIRVSDDPNVETAARYRIDDPDAVLAFLQAVARVRTD